MDPWQRLKPVYSVVALIEFRVLEEKKKDQIYNISFKTPASEYPSGSFNSCLKFQLSKEDILTIT